MDARAGFFENEEERMIDLEMAKKAALRLIANALRRQDADPLSICIPPQPDDDDVIVMNAFDEFDALRTAVIALLDAEEAKRVLGVRRIRGGWVENSEMNGAEALVSHRLRKVRELLT